MDSFMILFLHFLFGIFFIVLGMAAMWKREIIWQKIYRMPKKKSKFQNFSIWYIYLGPLIGLFGVGILFILAAFGIIPIFFSFP